LDEETQKGMQAQSVHTQQMMMLEHRGWQATEMRGFGGKPHLESLWPRLLSGDRADVIRRRNSEITRSHCVFWREFLIMISFSVKSFNQIIGKNEI
jgi:hypothetical protein